MSEFNEFFKNFFYNKNDREINKIKPIVELINIMEIIFIDLTDEHLQLQTKSLRNYIKEKINIFDYICEVNKRIENCFEKLQNTNENQIGIYLDKYKNLIFKNREVYLEGLKKNKMYNIALNSLIDIKIENLISKLSDRLITWKNKIKLPLLKKKLEYNWKQYLKNIDKNNVLDFLLPEAFSTVREVGLRVLGLRHFDVQLVGGIILHQGKIAEMKTGEGKTLVATLPVYLNALTGEGVHVATVNDYLAKRDCFWMGLIYDYLGMSSGVIYEDMQFKNKKKSYNCDITFGSSSTFGFDYLDDNLIYEKKDRVQRKFNFCIVDEIDSVLIDEAITPLIISEESNEKIDKYYRVNKLFFNLTQGERKEKLDEIIETGDYWIEPKTKTVALTNDGIEKCIKFFEKKDLFSVENIELVNCIQQMLIANIFYKKNVHYVIKNNQIIIVDEFTGRLLPNQRWSNGLHQAVEAKENLNVEKNDETMASITLQNYFKMYKKLSGMTGTADTEANEFWSIYKLDVVVIPPNKPVIRRDYEDNIFIKKHLKYFSIIELIKKNHQVGRPILVGTSSIKESEELSKLLKKQKIIHTVLNAKYHEKEASIIAKAGQKYAVTIATNMAGRGVDIILNREVKKLGGLLVIGSERNKSRRIDNQLIGRSGRQGEPGETIFFISLEDDLIKLFDIPQRVTKFIEKLTEISSDGKIKGKYFAKLITKSQKKVEAYNFEVRKELTNFDNIIKKQRETIYSFRYNILELDNIQNILFEIVEKILNKYIFEFCNKNISDENIELFFNVIFKYFCLDLYKFKKEFLNRKFSKKKLFDFVFLKIKSKLVFKIEDGGNTSFLELLKDMMLKIIDDNWRDHLYNLEYLEEGIHLQSYKTNYLLAYQRESFSLFEFMMNNIYESIIEYFFKMKNSNNKKDGLKKNNKNLKIKSYKNKKSKELLDDTKIQKYNHKNKKKKRVR